MKKAKRYIVARTLHLGCNAMDSARVLTWFAVLGDAQALTEKEHRILEQRSAKLKEMVEDVRKLANHIERSAK